MKVLGVVCSPRKGGNTEILVQEALRSAEESGAEVELWTIAGKDLKPCDGCTTCDKTGYCRIQDDIQELYPKLEAADGLIFGTPTYMWSVSAQAKMIIDRTRVLVVQHRLRDKAAAVVVTQTRAGGTSCFPVFWSFFNQHRMTISGGAVAFGRDRGDVKKDARGMAEAGAVGRVVVRNILRYQQINHEAPIEKPLAMPSRSVQIDKGQPRSS